MPNEYNPQNFLDTAAGGIFGIALGGINDSRQFEQQQRLQELQIKGQKEMMDYSMSKQMKMWLDTNYGAQVDQLNKAGLNPALLYGMKGGGGITTGSPQGNVAGAQAPQGGREIQDAIGMGIQMRLLQAQEENIRADTELKKADATKTGGADTANVQADTQNKILQQVINTYAGKEAKDVYERITSPNRAIQAKTYEDELAARQGIAGTIYEMWEEGKLKDMSIAQLEAILIQNAKTIAERKNIEKTLEIMEENLKGAKLDNVMKELESKMQTDTGVDRNAPTWLKVLARLFIGLTQK